MVMGVTMNHCIADGTALIDFMQSWSEIARGLPLSFHPHLDRSILSPRNYLPKIQKFPHPQYTKLETPLNPLPTNKMLATKSFCFTPKMLSQLRNSAMQKEAASPPPTTFELISALAWKCSTRAKKLNPDATSQMYTAVDIRNRLQPPLPNHYFGNCIVPSCAQSRAGEVTSQPLSYAVGIMHDSIRAVTDEYIRLRIDSLQDPIKFLELGNSFSITKWSRLPFYDIDFGWGVATQVAPAIVVQNSAFSFLQGNDKKNIVIRVTLPIEEMDTFQEIITSQFNQD